MVSIQISRCHTANRAQPRQYSYQKLHPVDIPKQKNLHPKLQGYAIIPMENAYNSTFLLVSPRLNNQHNNQACNHERKGDCRDQSDTTSARRKFTPDDPMLTLEISVETNKQNNNTDAQECRPQRFAQLSKMLIWIAPRARIVGYRCVKSEELRDCNSDRGKCERGSEPGKVGTLCTCVSGNPRSRSRSRRREEGMAVNSPRAK
jgi:hypothetical protein